MTPMLIALCTEPDSRVVLTNTLVNSVLIVVVMALVLITARHKSR